ncbi:MAG: OmpH family outer membrane protein [Bacteroidia bacterium]|jgi:outer membrane protein
MIKKALNTTGILCLIALSLWIYHSMTSSKVVYVDIPKVFNAFEMKKEFQEKFKKTESERKRVLDSLEFDLQLMSKKLGTNSKDQEMMRVFDAKRGYYFRQKNEMEQDNAALSNQYDKQILGQMSQYISDYGKQNGFDLVLGADGNGTLMYAAENMDVSNAVVQFINDKYKGNE